MYGIYELYGRSRYINNYETYIIYMYVLCACADCHNNKFKSEGKIPTNCKIVGNIPTKILKYSNFYYKISQQFKDFHFSFRIIDKNVHFLIKINSHLNHMHYI